MTRPIVRIHDIETNEIIDREMNDNEYKQFQADQKEFEAKKLQSKIESEAKAALLERLGITEDEAKLLLA